MQEPSRVVLLVEDNEDNRIIMSTFLTHAGYRVVEASTGTEAVERARDARPDVILMDVSLPELDGWAATRIIKADPASRHIPVIALTAHAMPGDRERSLDAGCDDYLAKPIEPTHVLQAVQRLLERAGSSPRA